MLSTAIWWGQPYWKELGYALCISTPIWAIIDVGRFMLVRPTDPVAWPRGVRGVLLVIAGIGLGFYFGSWLGDALFGIGDVPAPRHKLITALITIIASIAGFYFFYTRLDRAALSARISAAERDTAQARLKLLATQLEPHMLFNTLANLRALIGSDPPRAIATLDRLDNYLRVTLTGSLAHTHPLAAEFERLADYLALMQVRMGPRLRYALDLPDNLRSVPVPPLLLQPLVENSIRHGLETKVEGGQITVRARLDGGCLVIEVHDTGTGLDEAATTVNRGTGFGLTQIRQRLT
ncbi:MAG: histidine kinase, partial [Burkholderiaceae bacterium]|nr:histidine kinase [Burkholderiaceae bacterium]